MRRIYIILVIVAAVLGALVAFTRLGAKSGDAVGATNSATWQVVDKTDKMNPNVKWFDAEATLAADDGESFDLVAECSPGFINFTLDATAKDAAIETSDNKSYFLRTRLDDKEVVVAHADVEHPNEASIFFYDPDIAPKSVADGVGGAYGRVLRRANDGNTTDIESPLVKFMHDMSQQQAPAYLSANGAGTIKDLEAAGSLHIEVPMANGNKPMVTIGTRDPALLAFYKRCQIDTDARYPPAPPVRPTSSTDSAPAPEAAQSDSSGAMEPASQPDAPGDSEVRDLRARYVGKSYDDTAGELEAAGWKSIDGDGGYTIFQKGDDKIQILYQYSGGVHPTAGAVTGVARPG